MRNGRNATVHFLLLLRPDSEHRKTREALTTATAEILALRGEQHQGQYIPGWIVRLARAELIVGTNARILRPSL